MKIMSCKNSVDSAVEGRLGWGGIRGRISMFRGDERRKSTASNVVNRRTTIMVHQLAPKHFEPPVVGSDERKVDSCSKATFKTKTEK